MNRYAGMQVVRCSEEKRRRNNKITFCSWQSNISLNFFLWMYACVYLHDMSSEVCDFSQRRSKHRTEL